MERQRKHFHECIIAFITAGIRLGKWHWTSTWDEFHHEFRCPSYLDFSCLQLKNEFQNIILPNVFKYDLSYCQRKKLELLRSYQVCGPKLEETVDGFKVVPIDKDMETAMRTKIQENNDFATALSKDLDKIAAILLNEKDYEQIKFDSDGNIPVRKCVSLLLQDGNERLHESLLSWPEIQYRWKSKQDIAKSEDIFKEAMFFEKLHQGSKRHFQKKMNQCLLEKHELQVAMEAVRRQPQTIDPFPSTSQDNYFRGRRTLHFT